MVHIFEHISSFDQTLIFCISFMFSFSVIRSQGLGKDMRLETLTSTLLLQFATSFSDNVFFMSVGK